MIYLFVRLGKIYVIRYYFVTLYCKNAVFVSKQYTLPNLSKNLTNKIIFYNKCKIF